MKELRLLGLIETSPNKYEQVELFRFVVNVKGDNFIIPLDVPITKPITGISLTEVKVEGRNSDES